MGSRRPASIASRQPVRHMLLYGTLCASEPQHARLGLPRALTFLGYRRLRGRLYDLGPYPGLVLGGGTARAELHAIDDPGILPVLDRYEGYDRRAPARSLFVRITVLVTRLAQSNAASLPAWIYVYNGSIAGREEIAAPSWPEHRRRHAPRACVFTGSRRRRG